MSRTQPASADCLKPALEREHAQAAAQRMRQHDKTVRAYRCRDCGAWHVGGVIHSKRPMAALNTNHHHLGGHP